MALLTTIQSVICSLPVHLVCLVSLLGAEIHQSVFTAKKYLGLGRSDASLARQNRIAPVLLRAQSALLVLVAVTVPPSGLVSLVEHKSSWIPLLIGSYATALNMFLFGPRASRAFIDLKMQSIHVSSQGQCAGFELMKASDVVDSPQKSGGLPLSNPGTAALEKSLRRNRAVTMHLNIATVLATVWYGWGVYKLPTA